jgi:hypothetical protein
VRNYVVAVLGALVLQLSACGGGGGGGGGVAPAPSNNANLANLVLSAGPLNPDFAPATTHYTVDVRFSIADETTVTPTAADPGATIRLNGVVVASGTASGPIPLTPGGVDVIDVEVTAADGTTTKTYVVTVFRDFPNNDADLTALALSLTPLDQIFQSATLVYTASTGFLGASTQSVAVSSDELAIIDIEGVLVDSGEASDPIALVAAADTTIEVDVTAENGTLQTYRVLVSRAAAAAFAQRAYAKASNTDQDDLFANALAVSGDTLVVGAPGEASNATGVDGNQLDDSLLNAGAAYVFVRNGGVWTQQAYLKASNTKEGQRFGRSVAISGDTVADTIAIGAPGEASLDGTQVDISGSNVGAVYVFVRNGATWTQQAYLKASNADTDDLFSEVTLEDDVLVVGARGEGSAATGIDGDQTNDASPGAGAAYVFARNAGTWSQTTYIKSSNAEAGDSFGLVSLSGDSLAVGAVGENSGSTGVGGSQSDNSQVDAGATYLFAHNAGGNWVQQAYIKASNTDAGDGFGRVALEGDRLVVGAPGENSNATGIGGNQLDDSFVDAGAVYLFVRAGSIWSQAAYVKASNTDAGDSFGAGVTLWGSIFAVGAPGEQSNASGIGGSQIDNSLSAAGAVYVFEAAPGGLAQQLYVKASTPDTDDLFGSSLVVDGDLLVVGAPGEGSNATGVGGIETDDSMPNAGASYLFD